MPFQTSSDQTAGSGNRGGGSFIHQIRSWFVCGTATSAMTESASIRLTDDAGEFNETSRVTAVAIDLTELPAGTLRPILCRVSRSQVLQAGRPSPAFASPRRPRTGFTAPLRSPPHGDRLLCCRFDLPGLARQRRGVLRSRNQRDIRSVLVIRRESRERVSRSRTNEVSGSLVVRAPSPVDDVFEIRDVVIATNKVNSSSLCLFTHRTDGRDHNRDDEDRFQGHRQGSSRGVSGTITLC
jgi:hypothetical protein